jgi:hypothetical protein
MIIGVSERQRLALVRALLVDPGVLILNEPAAHLDPEARTALTADTDNPELANLYSGGAPGGSQFSGHADGVSRDIGMFGSAGSADFEGASCHHRCRRRGPYSGANITQGAPGGSRTHT